MSASNEYNNNKLKICKNCGYKINPSNNSNNYNDINQNYKSICIYEKSSVSYYNQIIDTSKLYKINSNDNNLEDTSLNTKNTEQNKSINKDNKKSSENKKINYPNDKSIPKRKTKKSKKLKSSTKKHKSKN